MRTNFYSQIRVTVARHLGGARGEGSKSIYEYLRRRLRSLQNVRRKPLGFYSPTTFRGVRAFSPMQTARILWGTQ